MELKKENIDRILLLDLERRGREDLSFKEAYKRIEKETKERCLYVSCSAEISDSIPLQAALVTIINTGKRCFLGGVFIEIEPFLRCRLPAWEGEMLTDVIRKLGGLISTVIQEDGYHLALGHSIEKEHGFEVICNDWSGGVMIRGESVKLERSNTIPIGGILAGSLAVGLTFLYASGIDKTVFFHSTGMSLWRPDIIDGWYLDEYQGPKTGNFPDKLWMLGLGHLGQAYAWTIGQFPFHSPNELEITLQDFDKSESGNISAGLLTEDEEVGRMKTRTVADWLESTGIETRLLEKKYKNSTHRLDDDPLILLAGLDKLEVRKALKVSEFSSVIDCGIGGDLASFDLIRINHFPYVTSYPEKLWKDSEQLLHMPETARLVKEVSGCGSVLGIAVSFVGSFCSCLVLAEILRAYNKGIKTKYQYLSMRELKNRRIKTDGNFCLNELNTGFIKMK